MDIINKVRNIIESKLNLEKDEQGYYQGEIFLDLRDMYLEDSGIIKDFINNGRECIEDFIIQCQCDYDVYEYDYVYKTIEENLTDEEYHNNYDEIQDFVNDYVSFVLPSDFVWGTEIPVNILISAYDDWDYEFTRNNIYEEDDKLVLDDGGIKWLIQQQGYSIEDFEKECNNDLPYSNRLFSSIVNEIGNTTTDLNALTVSVKMTLRELIDLREKKDNKTLKELKFDKTCDIGLVDFWLGAGSVLEIELEKDLVIPLENIYDINYDSNFCYGIGEIYGMRDSDYWNEVKYSVALA